MRDTHSLFAIDSRLREALSALDDFVDLDTGEILDGYEKQVDVLLSPTAPGTAFALGEQTKDPVTMYLNDYATIPANLAGVPGISVPGGLVDGLPYGLQFTAPAREDARLYEVGAAVEALVTRRGGSPVWAQAPELEKGAQRRTGAERATTTDGGAA